MNEQTPTKLDLTTHADAHRIAGLGWFVFPLADEIPAIKSGYSIDFDPTSMVAPWAQAHVRHAGARWRLADGKQGSYWATRNPRLIDTLFGHIAQLHGGYGIGITSDRLVIDIDAPKRVPADIAALLGRLPHLTTPSGGLHYFAATGAGDSWQTGGLHDDEGQHIGDLKHLRATYSVAYNGLPAYADCNARPDPRVGMWLRDVRKQRAQPQSRPTQDARAGACLRPSTFTDWSRAQPADLEGVERGRHDLMRDGTMRDAAEGVDRRAEWTATMVAAGRDPQTAEDEVNRAADGAVRKVETETNLRAELSELKALNAALTATALAKVRQTGPEEPSVALYERYRDTPEHVDLKPYSLATVARRGNCRGRYNRMQRGDAAIEIQIDDGEYRSYSDELHAAHFWGRCEEVATCNGRPWREPALKRRREMLLRWVGAGAYDGPGTDVVQDVLNALESLPAEREFVPRDLALEWARARRTTEEDAPNAVGNEIWTDIRKAFAAHGQRPENGPWREDRITVKGKRVRGWARRDGSQAGVKLAGGEG